MGRSPYGAQVLETEKGQTIAAPSTHTGHTLQCKQLVLKHEATLDTGFLPAHEQEACILTASCTSTPSSYLSPGGNRLIACLILSILLKTRGQ